MSALFTYPSQELEADERFTPAWVFEGLGLEFDLDPASPIGIETFVPARVKLTREDDGLATAWSGMVWCNPPFSQMTAWADKFVAHGSGVLIGPIGNSAWTIRALRAADAVYLMRDMNFWHPLRKGQQTGHAIAMIGMGVEPARAMSRAAEVWGPKMGALLTPVVNHE